LAPSAKHSPFDICEDLPSRKNKIIDVIGTGWRLDCAGGLSWREAGGGFQEAVKMVNITEKIKEYVSMYLMCFAHL